MIKKFLAVPAQSKITDVVLLITRIVVGYAFIMHGMSKIQAPMSWMGADSSVPGIFQALAAISEFGGGIALILGLLTGLASLGLWFTMAVAVYMHAMVFGHSFLGKDGSYELPLVYLLVMSLFLALGPGRYSADQKIFGVRS